MGVPTNAFLTFAAVGNREGLSDLISRIDPTETPFQSNAGKTSTSTVLYEWQNQALATPNGSNAVLEGADAVATAATATSRLGNRHQISEKTASVSRTQRRVKKAGRGDEMDYQLILKGLELRRDLEVILTGNQGAAAGSAGVARKTASLGAMIITNVDKEATGTNPTDPLLFTDPRNDGATRALTLAFAKNVVKLMYDNGAKVEGAMVMVGSANKQLFSTFTGIATQTYYVTKVGKSALIGGLDVWVTDFGTVEVAPNRFQRSRDAWFLDFSKIRVGYIDDMFTTELAITGDSLSKQIICEYTLIIDNEKGQGLVADLS